jgi:hypothetical protein
MTALTARLNELRNASDRVVLVPYTLSIVDCYFLFTALRKCAPHGELTLDAESAGHKRSVCFRSAFDMYDFDRDIDETETLLSCRGNSVYWDEEARFVAVAGTSSFCDDATPYPREIAKHYFMEGMLTLIPDETLRRLYDELTK